MALNPIVKKNLKLMRSRQSGGMAGMSESIGGNAGSNNSAHNFYYNKGNGEIVYFGNIQNVPEKIKKNPQIVEGSFIIKHTIKVTTKIIFSQSKIKRIIFSKQDCELARINFALTAEMYDELVGRPQLIDIEKKQEETLDQKTRDLTQTMEQSLTREIKANTSDLMREMKKLIKDTRKERSESAERRKIEKECEEKSRK